jgi:hypothetical protein
MSTMYHVVCKHDHESAVKKGYNHQPEESICDIEDERGEDVGRAEVYDHAVENMWAQLGADPPERDVGRGDIRVTNYRNGMECPACGRWMNVKRGRFIEHLPWDDEQDRPQFDRLCAMSEQPATERRSRVEIADERNKQGHKWLLQCGACLLNVEPNETNLAIALDRLRPELLTVTEWIQFRPAVRMIRTEDGIERDLDGHPIPPAVQIAVYVLPLWKLANAISNPGVSRPYSPHGQLD